jgi:hypothetical protein
MIQRKLFELAVIIALGATILLFLNVFTIEDITSFNPFEWLADSIKGFFDWIINLFFGWMK